MSNDVPPAGAPPAIRAGKAFQDRIESDPEARAAWERIGPKIKETLDVIRANHAFASDVLDRLDFGRPKSLEDWEHLARVIEIPYDIIKSGTFTLKDVYDYALAWADRQQIKAGLTAPAELPELVAAQPSGNETVATEAVAELPELVTLDQAAALVNRSARTLERYKKRGLPRPFVLGGGGKPHEYPLDEMREWLQKTFNRPIPEAAIERFQHPKNT